jgi:predicted AAA+ superfamily ATPase
MIQRLLNPSQRNSFFLFGARGTGKSTFVNSQFPMQDPWVLNLLDPEVEDYYAKSPKRIELELRSRKAKPDWIVIDEIQKVPRLLDMVHKLIEERKQRFILTGSSARKLKRGAANLLAGRAFLYHLFPLTSVELGDNFDLDFYLRWGGLPQIYSYENEGDRTAFLRGYTLNYLNQEIRLEQVVRKLDPFRNFLEIAGSSSGKIINHKKIGEQVGVDTKTIQSYFQILEDTLLGFYLPGFHQSVRKSQKINPKFFLFDLGVKKSLEGSLDQTLNHRTSVFGQQFEAFLILEIFRLNDYYSKEFKLSYFATKGGSEIDLILSKAQSHILIEIKSTDTIDEVEVSSLSRFVKSFPRVKAAYYISRDPHSMKQEGVQCLHWNQFLRNFQSLK